MGECERGSSEGKCTVVVVFGEWTDRRCTNDWTPTDRERERACVVRLAASCHKTNNDNEHDQHDVLRRTLLITTKAVRCSLASNDAHSTGLAPQMATFPVEHPIVAAESKLHFRCKNLKKN